MDATNGRPTPFQSLVSRRFSCRAYKPDPVPREHVEAMLKAARLAPSACNRQPWRLAVVTSPARRKDLLCKGVLPGLSMPWIADAPVIIALGMRRATLTHRVAPLIAKVDYPWLDCGIAGEHLVLQATELGLGTCWIGWIRPRGIRRVIGWPPGIRPVALITVGWPQDPQPPERNRKPLSDIASWMPDSP